MVEGGTSTRGLRPSHEVLQFIAEIDEFKGRWEALKTLSPERLRALRHVATIESIGSSTRIEGVKLTDRQIETLGDGFFQAQSLKFFVEDNHPRSTKV